MGRKGGLGERKPYQLLTSETHLAREYIKMLFDSGLGGLKVQRELIASFS